MLYYLSKMKKVIAFVLLIGLFTACLEQRELPIPPKNPASGALIVNEVASRWTTAIPSEFQDLMRIREQRLIGTPDEGDFPNGTVKWFELYNNSDDTIRMNDGLWYLSDDPDNEPDKNKVLSTVKIAPSGWAIVYCDTLIPSTTQIHSNFGISRRLSKIGVFFRRNEGDALSLIDTLTYPDGVNNRTYNRFPDGNKSFTQGPPTPGAANQQ